MSKPIVYVVQEPPKLRGGIGDWPYKYDIRRAERYGKLELVLNWSEGRTLGPFQMLQTFRNRLANFQEHDSLLLIGSPMAMALSVLVAAQRVQVLNILLHDRTRDMYYRIELKHADLFPSQQETSDE
jgi:hypothetical protein